MNEQKIDASGNDFLRLASELGVDGKTAVRLFNKAKFEHQQSALTQPNTGDVVPDEHELFESAFELQAKFMGWSRSEAFRKFQGGEPEDEGKYVLISIEGAWQSWKLARASASQPPEQVQQDAPCINCNETGSVQVYEDSNPATRATTVDCQKCKGNGYTIEPAAKQPTAPDGEAVGEIEIYTGNGLITAPFHQAKWYSGFMPPVGTKLYTKPQGEAVAELDSLLISIYQEFLAKSCQYATDYSETGNKELLGSVNAARDLLEAIKAAMSADGRDQLRQALASAKEPS